jgi:hypothetical protein
MTTVKKIFNKLTYNYQLKTIYGDKWRVRKKQLQNFPHSKRGDFQILSDCIFDRFGIQITLYIPEDVFGLKMSWARYCYRNILSKYLRSDWKLAFAHSCSAKIELFDVAAHIYAAPSPLMKRLKKSSHVGEKFTEPLKLDVGC